MTNAEIDALIARNLPSGQEGYITAEKLREAVKAIAEMTLVNILERGNLTSKNIEIAGNQTIPDIIGFSFDSFGNDSKVGIDLINGQPSITYNSSSFTFDDSIGIHSNAYHGDKYTDNSYVQKKYVDENFKPALQTFILQQPQWQNYYEGGPIPVPIYMEDLGGGVRIAPKLPLVVDVDLSKGNYAVICLGVNVKSLTLPSIYKDSLTYLELFTKPYSLDNIIDLRISDYPNLASAYIHPGNRANKHHSIKIIDEVIDLPRLGGLHLGGSKRVPWAVTNPDITLKIYRGMSFSLCSTTLKNLVLDFATLNPSGIYAAGPYTYPNIPYYTGFYAFTNNSNLTDVAIKNLAFINNSFLSEFTFSFTDCSLKQTSVDHILNVFNKQFTNTTNEFSRMELNLHSEQKHENLHPSDELGLIVGNTYQIDSILGTDDFSNVGFVADGVPFVATGTTPTEWLASTVDALSYGQVNKIELVSTGTPLPDGGYSCNNIWMRWEAGVMVELEVHSPFADELNRTMLLNYFTITSQDDPSVVIWGNDSDEYDVTVIITKVAKNATPTGGLLNPDYLELLKKNWVVNINS